MSSTPPSRDNGYLIPLDQWADRDFFQGVFSDVHDRLSNAEAKEVDYDEAINLIVTQALATVTNTVGQEIASQRAILTEIQSQAEDILEEYNSRNIAATRVLLTAIPGLSATTAQTAIAELLSRKADLAGADFTGTVGLRSATPRLMAKRQSDAATLWDVLSIAEREFRIRVFDPAQPGALSSLILTYNSTASWNGFELWSAGNAPDAKDAEADAGTEVARRMWSPARLWRAVRAALPLPTDAQLDAGADTAPRSITMAGLRRAALAALKRREMPTFTAVGGETQVIFSIPAGSRSVSLEGSFTGSDSANTALRARLSFDGGATYLSAADSYQWQNTNFGGTTGTTQEAVGNFMPFCAPSDGGIALMSQFKFDLDFFPGRHARFRGRIGHASGTSNRLVFNDGFIRRNDTPSHILIFQQGGSFIAGTQIRAEAR